MLRQICSLNFYLDNMTKSSAYKSDSSKQRSWQCSPPKVIDLLLLSVDRFAQNGAGLPPDLSGIPAVGGSNGGLAVGSIIEVEATLPQQCYI